ncbi:pentatricopeptide repeat-containing protein [Dorcoceras hygrometricum]|uniref:Pentatricopeptide repeat-containing protein n=1 Tax=Dorcoceras hygrometricum TaxID=472368 RepID=A0A2Z7BBP9_9LAMI|nr:pentatricopeptide repeat-containing protein [Dorcoceras hygrometricum]
MIVAPQSQAFHHLSDPVENFISKAPIHLSLNRPDYNPPPSIKIKSPPKKSNPKPITTTSDVLYLMDSLKLPLQLDIYASLVTECTKLRDPFKAVELHKHMRKGRIRLSLPLLNRILLMYVSCGCTENARQLFDQMFVRDFSTWAVMIAGFCEEGSYIESVSLFTKMLREQHFSDFCDRRMKFLVIGIVAFVLKACVGLMDLELGMQVHCWSCKMGYSKDAALSSSLINFYGKMKRFEVARNVFEHICSQNTAIWTSRVVNCSSDDDFEGAVFVFKEMGTSQVRKNSYTFSSVFKACGRMADLVCGQQVHADAIKLGLESDVYVLCALVDMYGRCGSLHDAYMAFDTGRDKRNGACYNVMVKNYVEHGYSLKAIKILDEMKEVGLEPCESLLNEVRFVDNITRWMI